MWYRIIFQFLFPPRCVSCGIEGTLLCHDCLSRLPERPHVVYEDSWALAPYHHPVTERIVRAIKYEGKKNLTETAGIILSKALPSIINSEKGEVVVVAIPSSRHEYTKRGYDHTALIAQSLATHAGLLYLPALEKIRDTARQVEMKSRLERLKNLEGAFRQRGVDLEGKIILLIDDVTTTGATFQEARRALMNSGATKIVCFAIAH